MFFQCCNQTCFILDKLTKKEKKRKTKYIYLYTNYMKHFFGEQQCTINGVEYKNLKIMYF